MYQTHQAAGSRNDSTAQRANALFPRMGITIRRIFAYLVEAALLLFAGGRLILDLIGWSTVPDDVGVAVSWVERFAAWLISVPWWVTYGSATAGLMGLIYFSWPRPVYLPAPPTDPAMTASTPKGLTDAAPLALPASPALEIAAPVEASINPTSIYGTSDQCLRLRRDGGPGGGMAPLSGKKRHFRVLIAAFAAFRPFSGRLVLMPSAFFAPGTGCRARTA